MVIIQSATFVLCIAVYLVESTLDFGLEIRLVSPNATDISIPSSVPMEIIVEVTKANPPVKSSKWLMNGIELTKSSSIIISEINDTRRLKLLNPTVDSTGNYTLNVETEALEKSVTISVRVQAQQQLQPEVEAIPPYFESGQSVQLICSVTVGQTVGASLAWILPKPKQDDRFKILNLTSSDENGKTFVTKLVISDLATQDEGEYVCDVRDSLNNQKKEIYKLKLANEFGIKLKLRNHKTTVISAMVSTPVELIVDIFSIPYAKKITWLHNTELENNTNGVLFYNKEWESRLIITDTRLESSGVYSLLVDNGQLEKTLDVTVNIVGAPIVKMEEDGFGFFYLGKEFDIKCNIEGPPDTVVKWYQTPCGKWPRCDNKSTHLLPTNSISMKYVKSTSTLHSTLRIKSTETAVLRCEACVNKFCGDANYTFYATDLPGVPGDLALVGPEEVVTGDNFALKCAASKYSYTKEMLWTNQETEDTIEDEERINQTETKYSYVSLLSFRNVTLKDEGKYLCDTSFSSDTALVPKTLTYYLKLLKPQLPKVQNGRAYKAMLNEEVKMECTVVSYGVPRATVKWFKGDIESSLVELTGQKWHKSLNNTLTFLVEEEDEGLYWCVAVNSVGSASVTNKLVVEDVQNNWTGSHWIVMLVLFLVVVSILTFLYLRKSKNDKLMKCLRGNSEVEYNERELRPALQQNL